MPHVSFLLKLITIATLMIAPLVACLAFFYPISTDFIFYATILNGFSTQLWQGELYPRWLNMNGGLGSPVFLFYSPLAYYVGSVWQWLAPFDGHGFLRVLLSMWAALIVSGITCYRWLLRFFPASQAQAGALVYAGFPYLLIIIYFSFGLSQLWAIALFPFMLEMADRLIKREALAFPLLALSYAALCMVHLPSFIVFCAIPIIYSWAFSQKEKHAIWVYKALLAAALGTAMAAIYIAPALMNKPFIASEAFLSGKYAYEANFFHAMAIIGAAIICLPLLVFYNELPKLNRTHYLPQALRQWLYIMAGLLFMASPLSLWLWQWLPPLQHLQFPFRFFVGMLPGVAFIAASWFSHAPVKKYYRLLFIMAAVLSLVGSLEFAFRANPASLSRYQANHIGTPPEYYTPWMLKADVTNNDAIAQKATMLPYRFAKGSGHVEIERETTRVYFLKAQVKSENAVLVFRRFYFPGWQSNAGEIQEHGGLLALALPQGDHKVTLSLPYYAGEREGMIISALALALWALGFIFSLSRRPRGFISKA